MPWLELSLNLAATDDVQRAEDALFAVGALSVTLQDAADQPVLEPGPGETPLWPHMRAIALYDADTDMGAVKDKLGTLLPFAIVASIAINPLEDRDWTRAWMDRFQPMRFGRRLWVCPDGFAPPEPQAVNLRLDPGLAFGTGTHPTTALCLEWLDGHDITGLRVIDFGCGSGVLAIAALLLGAQHVWAVDNDPQAIVATRDNAAKNHVAEALFVDQADRLPRMQADLLIANILAAPIVELAARFATHVRPGGTVVLSGILDHQAGAIESAYCQCFDIGPIVQRDGWVRLEGIRK